MAIRDTVEEFWDRQVLASQQEAAHQLEGPSVFAKALTQHLESNGDCHLFTSGRLALQYYLEQVSAPGRDTVLICSFNCPVVLEAVQKAGLRAETFDLARPNGGFDWDALQAQFHDRTLAVVVPHLFGVPVDLRPILKPAADRHIFVVEDCAHTLGGRIADRVAGNLGDAAIFSFNYDKPISLGGGGALLINHPQQRQSLSPQLEPYGIDTEMADLSDFLDYLTDRRRRIPQAGPLHRFSKRLFRKLGIRQPLPLPDPGGFGKLRAALGLWQLERYKDQVAVRNQNAAHYRDTAFLPWHCDPEVTPAYIKLKLLPKDRWPVAHISSTLQRKGLRVGTFNWPRTVEAQLGLVEKPNAARAAALGLDVPVHSNMDYNELNLIVEVLKHY